MHIGSKLCGIALLTLLCYNNYDVLYCRFENICENAPLDASIILVGNKVDLTNQRMVSEEMAREMACRKGIEYFECSTKENYNVKETFDYVLDLIIDKMGIMLENSEAHRTERKQKCKC